MSAQHLSAHTGDGAGASTPPDRPVADAPTVARALHDLTDRFWLVLENVSDVILQYDADGVLLWASPSLRTTFGYDDEAAVGTRLSFEHSDDEDVAEAYVEARMRDGSDVTDNHTRVVCADGTVRWASSRTRVVRRADGDIDYVVVTFRDVTEQIEADHPLVASEVAQHMRPVVEDGVMTGRVSTWRAAATEIDTEKALATAEAHFRMLAENSTDVVLHTDSATGLVDWVSPSSRWILGYERDELVGTRVMDLLHPDDLARVRHLIRTLLARGEMTGGAETRILKADGSWLWMNDSGRAVRSEDGTVVGGIDSLRDISAEHAMRETLAEQARRDSLTGLPNRRDLLERLEAVLSHEPRAGTVTAVLFLDLDRLKLLNDRYGHRLGDDVLIEVGQRITKTLRADDVVGRLAGDEYVVVLPNLAAPGDAWLVADAIHDRMRAAIVVGDVHVHVSVSIGLTVARPGERPEDVLHRADVALYRAKGGGRSRTEADVSEDGLDEFAGSTNGEDDALGPELPAPLRPSSGTAAAVDHDR